MEYSFRLHKFNKAGQYVLREGDPVTHIALVKEGEFDVVKRNLKGLDARLVNFLHKGDFRKKLSKQVLLLPGRTSIYQRTNQLLPPFEVQTDNSFMRDKSLDIEQLAFNSVSDKLYEIARMQAQNASKQNLSLNALKTSKVDKFKDIRISINGTGYVFGDYDAFTEQDVYQYSLRASHAGATCYLMEKKDFLKFAKQYAAMGEVISNTVFEKDMEMMRQLTRIVFNIWYRDLQQENLKVVPDLDPEPISLEKIKK